MNHDNLAVVRLVSFGFVIAFVVAFAWRAASELSPEVEVSKAQEITGQLDPISLTSTSVSDTSDGVAIRLTFAR